jgi:hypothetical protein
MCKFFKIEMSYWGLFIIEANSPQAKGRVERGNKTHQDRLTRSLRFRNIVTIEEANRYLEKEYIEEHNNKFSLTTKTLNGKLINKETGLEVVDVHRLFGKDVSLNDICYIEEIRKVNNDWTISYKGILYQLRKQSIYRPPCKSTVYVRLYIDESISIFYRNIPIEYTQIK